MLLLSLIIAIALVNSAACHTAEALFDAREATISSTHHALFTGLTSCRAVVSAFISRIEALNNNTNAIIALNPEALAIASDLDDALSFGNATRGSLFCIPVLLKDNYDLASLPTTGGCKALADARPVRDAASVAALKRAGAIILGKANLHELALEGISVSTLGGQTINPYDRTRTPGGSSGGSGAAIAASFAIFSTGTDTVNSLRSPASANSLFSCRPTRGLISRQGIIPISYTQDVAGPIARSVRDVATALTVMSSVGYDARDNDTALVPVGIRDTDYTGGLEFGSLQGLRLGLIEGFFNRTASNETDPINTAFDEMVAFLEASGAEVIPINETIYNTTRILAELDTQRYEYRELLTAYLASEDLVGRRPLSMNELYEQTEEFVVLPSQYEYVQTALVSSTSNATIGSRKSYDTVKAGIRDLTLALQKTFSNDRLDAVVYPQQKNLVVKLGAPSQSGRNGILAALTGSPVVMVPAGFSASTEDAPFGIPIGMEILGQPWTEKLLLQIAFQIEQNTLIRKPPTWARQVIPIKEYDAVPSVTPDISNIPLSYPIGTLSSS